MPNYRLDPDRLPKLTHHKASGNGVVRLGGRDHYCGRFGTPECQAKYLRVVSEWIANGRKGTTPQDALWRASHPPRPPQRAAPTAQTSSIGIRLQNECAPATPGSSGTP